MSPGDPDKDPDPEGLKKEQRNQITEKSQNKGVDIIQNSISTCVGTYKNKDTT